MSSHTRLVREPEIAEVSERARLLMAEGAAAAATSPNEASLRLALETALGVHLRALGTPWSSAHLEVFVRTGDRKGRRFIDVAHGAVLIEYEPPNSFSGRLGAALRHAQAQLEEYAILRQREEGRPLGEYEMVAWDGAHICFGRYAEEGPAWERLSPFDARAAERLIHSLLRNGIPLVSPELVSALVGPESELGAHIIPLFFVAVREAVVAGKQRTSKTFLLFTEWRRLFGQVVGSQSEQLRKLLEAQGEAHGQPYSTYVGEYLFALNTYIALVAKLVAALALPRPRQNVADGQVEIGRRIRELESGRLFVDAGVLNMLPGDFFSWYQNDPHWPELAPPVERLVETLGSVSFDVTRKTPDSTRDLFKGLYQSFVPRALRHALGEYYTPDWLAAHTLDQLEWQPDDALLDPTCGSGTFLLEALRRRLCEPGEEEGRSAHDCVRGLYGIDLNPLAVLTARASFIVYLSPFLDPARPIRLPIFLADALNPTERKGDLLVHRLQTELGTITFSLPERLQQGTDFYVLFGRIRELVEARQTADAILDVVVGVFGLGDLNDEEAGALRGTLESLVLLHDSNWDGIWCAILAERFAAGAIPQVEHICGNPPWVKWSHLPPEYAEFIKDRCFALGVFSDDRWVGGIESDVSTVVTYEVIDRWLAPGGKLAFLITGTVFVNESSQGFRRFRLRTRDVRFGVLRVEDFSLIKPFEGVSNYASLLLIERDHPLEYPVPYLVWGGQRKEERQRDFATAEQFRAAIPVTHLRAQPVPGSDAGPWMKGTDEDHELWDKLFSANTPRYVARKGVTTDRNGIFFVRASARGADGSLCEIVNEPSLGRIRGIPSVTALVECEHLFPLLRGRGVSAFRAVPDPEFRLLLPQRGMHGDPELPIHSRRAFQFLASFQGELEARSSYRRFQSKQPFWSLWSTGAYTFSAFKVVWRELSGGRFAAAYVGSVEDPLIGRKLVIPDHKLYFVPVDSEDEAAYLTGLLNAPVVVRAVSAYAAQLSLGASVAEYLDLPAFDTQDVAHAELASLARAITARAENPEADELKRLDELAHLVFGTA